MKRILFSLLFIIPLTGSIQAQVKKSDSVKKLSNGKKVYTQYCLSCHQIDGGGVMNMNPPLTNTKYVLGAPNQLINIILKGYNKGVTIDDNEYTNAMPPLSTLSDQQIADVLSFVRNNFGNKASLITVSQVKAERDKK